MIWNLVNPAVGMIAGTVAVPDGATATVTALGQASAAQGLQAQLTDDPDDTGAVEQNVVTADDAGRYARAVAQRISSGNVSYR